MMTNYLIRQGHRRIAFLADQQEPAGVDRERLLGYQKALEENGIIFHERDYVPISFRKQTRHTRLWEFCQERLNEYTALFFASDFMQATRYLFFNRRGYVSHRIYRW